MKQFFKRPPDAEVPQKVTLYAARNTYFLYKKLGGSKKNGGDALDLVHTMQTVMFSSLGSQIRPLHVHAEGGIGMQQT